MKNCSIACISDIHLGHRRNSTLDILAALDESIFRQKLLKRVDVLFFAGDLFDRLLDLSYEYLPEIDKFLCKVLIECSANNVIFRLLEGTPSHDAGQPDRSVTLYEMLGLESNFKYINTLSLEYIQELDARVLYIPDELNPTTDKTQKQVVELLESQGVDQVDLVVMHGQFPHQLGFVSKQEHCHDPAFFETITKQVIFVGHIHTPSIVGKIVAQGSFDRLSHGEEEAKGYAVVEIKNNKSNIFLVENKLSRIYKTYKAYDTSMEELFEGLQDFIKSFPYNACIRIEAEPTHPVFSNMAELSNISSTVVWTKLAKKKEDKNLVEVAVPIEEWHPMHISKSNIISIMSERLSGKYQSNDCSYMLNQLEELK